MALLVLLLFPSQALKYKKQQQSFVTWIQRTVLMQQCPSYCESARPINLLLPEKNAYLQSLKSNKDKWNEQGLSSWETLKKQVLSHF